MTDLLLIGHGSRDPAAAKEFGAVVELVEARLDGRRVGGGFLELADPPIDDGGRRAGGGRAPTTWWPCRTCCSAPAT